jgi:hypothetical protein
MFVTIVYFPTKEEAAQAYDAWAVRVKGKDTYLNRV